MGKEPVVEFGILIGLGPGIVAGIRIDCQLNLAATESLERVHHALRFLEFDHWVFGAMEGPDRQALESLRPSGIGEEQLDRIASAADGHDGGETLIK